MTEAPLFIAEDPSRSIHNIYRKAMKLVAREGVNIIFIDNLNLIDSENEKQNIYEKYASLSKFFKKLAYESGVPVVVNVDVSDPAVFNAGVLDGIKHYADTIINLSIERSNPEKAKLHLERNRSGPVGILNLDYYPSFCKFREGFRGEARGVAAGWRSQAAEQKLIDDSLIQKYTEAIRLDPTSAFAYRARGRVYLQLGKMELAIQDLEKALSIESKG